MLFLCLFKIFGKCERRAFGKAYEKGILYAVKEFAVAQACVFDENAYVRICLFVFFAFAGSQGAELVRYLFNYMCRDLFYICAVLKVAARYVERQLGAVYGAAEHKKVLRNDFLDVVGNEYLIVIQLYLPLKVLIFAVQLGEEEYTLEVERVVGVDVYPEERVVCIEEELMIEFDVLLRLYLGGLARPKRCGVVYRLFLVMAGAFGAFLALVMRVSVLFAVVEVYRHGNERTVAVEHRAEARGLKVFLFVLRNVHYHLGAAALAVALGYFVLASLIAYPVDCRTARI